MCFVCVLPRAPGPAWAEFNQCVLSMQSMCFLNIIVTRGGESMFMVLWCVHGDLSVCVYGVATKHRLKTGVTHTRCTRGTENVYKRGAWCAGSMCMVCIWYACRVWMNCVWYHGVYLVCRSYHQTALPSFLLSSKPRRCSTTRRLWSMSSTAATSSLSRYSSTTTCTFPNQ